MNGLTDQEHLIIIGAQRSGSSWLYELLDAHPEIHMQRPRRPEPKYFLNESCSYKDYRSLVFSNAPTSMKYLGEKSTSYYEVPQVPERIFSCLPDAKCLFILRDPVERALSNYRFSVHNGLETRTLEEVFLTQSKPPTLHKKTSVDPFDYLSRGEYSKYIASYKRLFKKNLHLMILEKALIDEKADGLWEFLGLFPVGASLSKVNASPDATVPISVRRELQQYYASELELLEVEMGRNLDIWRNQWERTV